MTDRPDHRPEEQQDEGGYYFAEEPQGRLADPDGEEASETPREPDELQEPDPELRENFRRTTPARLKTIRPERPKGNWGLVVWTALYVMISASAAASLPVGARMAGHVLFWLALGAGTLVTIQRERANDWEPAPRWPWAVALITGTLAVELLVATVSPLLIVAGSAAVMSVGLVILLMLG
ncbi:transcriptional regulator [Actinorugispora endophytica]|uniref:Uncharacterized protein n=1 Tax=Actinorugispora endophytica TaxID=1605990 RepID=A0A4R6UJW1_9ACTN|nr:transcriptional regulator [Actinorugispora endophytica]TDQ45603.1 hypothetical protein EV190_1302 [Actinorugispora endophytica]